MGDMKRTISLNGIPTVYTLERKRVKNVNLRVRGGEVFVSAPRWVPSAVIEGFLRERADFILGALERTERTPFPPCEDGAALPWRGRTLTLALGRGSRSSARVEGGVLRLCVRDAQDAESVRRALDRWYRAESEALCLEAFDRLYPQFAARARDALLLGQLPPGEKGRDLQRAARRRAGGLRRVRGRP